MAHLSRDLHGGILPGPGKCHANVAVYGWTSRDARLVISRDSALKRSDLGLVSSTAARWCENQGSHPWALFFCFFPNIVYHPYIRYLYYISYGLGGATYINNCTYINIYICIYVYTVYVCECVCVCAHVCARMCVHACVSLSRMVIILAMYV